MGNRHIEPAARSQRTPGSRRGWGRAACVGLVVLSVTFASAGWAQRSYDDLDDAVRDLTRTLVERGELVALFSAADLAGKRVLVKSDDFFETETGFRLPLSKVLSRKCATELTRSRVPVALEGSDEDAVRVLHGRWKRVPGGRLDLTLFVAEPVQGRGEPVALVSVDGRVPVQGIKPEDIEPTLEHWGRYLVRRLDGGVRDQDRRTVHIRPLSIQGKEVAQPDELGRELADWLAEALLESRWFDFVEPAPSGSAASVEVDGELLGRATMRGEHVKVSVRVLDNQRRLVTAASVNLPKVLFLPVVAESNGGVGGRYVAIESGVVEMSRDKLDALVYRGKRDPCKVEERGILGERRVFEAPFLETPEVVVALQAIDIDVEDKTTSAVRIRARVPPDKIDTDGFSYELVTWCNTTVYWAAMSWIAYGYRHPPLNPE